MRWANAFKEIMKGSQNYSKPILSESCEELSKKFYSLKRPRDVAKLLEVPFDTLTYYLYRIAPERRYQKFYISKRSGGSRLIKKPHNSLYLIQRKFSQVLYAIYETKHPVHGFAVSKSIVTNAKAHTNKKYVLNIDIKDFFGSINFGRVRGMFMAQPYYLDEKVATVLAQICCFENSLPQGAPTSPIISNLICQKMDRDLQRFSKSFGVYYTRYADDITFSSTRKALPKEIVALFQREPLMIVIGKELNQIIKRNGFEINQEKTRLFFNNQRQEVTGLVVNSKVNVDRKYIRNVYGALHAWKKYGFEKAEKVYLEKYAKNRMLYFRDDLTQNSIEVNEEENKPSMIDSLRGRIEFIGAVRGKSDNIYKKLCSYFLALVEKELDK
jgi:RNA-directed DNA polymerase